jgi:hypothetical protein
MLMPKHHHCSDGAFACVEPGNATEFTVGRFYLRVVRSDAVRYGVGLNPI